MSLYNMLFGMNGQSDLLLAVVGLRKVDVERFRDVSASEDGSCIEVYTRTGGGNREGYPNEAMRHAFGWKRSADDDFDYTYCTDYFDVPEEWRADVAGLRDPLAHGLRKEFANHLAKTLQREPTEADKAQAAHDAEAAALRRTQHFMANGHTFVPQSDAALVVALKLAEANGGTLRSCWGIAPLALTVKQNFLPWPKATDEASRKIMVRVEVNYDYSWKMDMDYWRHVESVYGPEYPLTVAKIRKTVEQYAAKAAK